MKAFKLGFAIAAALLASVGSTNAQRVVQVGYVFTAPNNSSVDPKTNLPQGTMIDVMNAIGKDAGFQIQYRPVIDIDTEAMLTAKIMDIGVVPSSTAAPGLGVVLKSFGSYCCNEALFVAKSDTKEYKSLADLKGATVASHPATLAAVQKTGLFVEVVKSPNAADALNAVATGQVKAAVVPVALGTQLLGAYPNVQISRSYVTTIPVGGFGLKLRQTDTELLAQIDKSASKLMTDGTVKAIYSKYGQDWSAPK